jgi:hypothetical protein
MAFAASFSPSHSLSLSLTSTLLYDSIAMLPGIYLPLHLTNRASSIRLGDSCLPPVRNIVACFCCSSCSFALSCHDNRRGIKSIRPYTFSSCLLPAVKPSQRSPSSLVLRRSIATPWLSRSHSMQTVWRKVRLPWLEPPSKSSTANS